MADERERENYTLVVRRPCFGLPTACPSCLPVFLYLRFANTPFHLDFNLVYPDSGKEIFFFFFLYLLFFSYRFSEFNVVFLFFISESLVGTWNFVDNLSVICYVIDFLCALIIFLKLKR